MGRRRFMNTASRFNPRTLERDLHRAQKSASTVHDVLVKYARTRANGKVIRCFPSQAETNPHMFHSTGKVIFDTVDHAVDYVVAMRQRFGDTLTTYVYSCNRSRHGHVHITTKKTGWMLVEVKSDGSIVDWRSSTSEDR